ncbi:MAG TPA: hypothetical protein VHO01_10580 [Jatrophihabitans sp.]|nr:hypothetical protein [Jatrophihabitans sp.]
MSNELTVRSEPEPQPIDRPLARSEWWLLDRLALLFSVLTGVVIFAFIGRGGWYVDDFLNLGIAQESKFNRFYIDRPIFGHPQQGTRILNWVLYRVAPMNYALAAGLVCLGLALMTWLIYRVLRLSFRPSPWVLVLTGMAGLTGLWIPVAEWWAGGSEITGCVLANVLMVHALLRCYRGPRGTLWGLLGGVWFILGLAFYERTLFGAVFAACFVLAVGCRRFSIGEIVRVIRQALVGYLTLLVVALGYLYYYATHKFVHRNPGYTTNELLHYLWITWSKALIPGLFGGTLQTHRNMALSYADPTVVWQVICQLALLAVIGWGLRTLGWRALVGWLIFVPIFAAATYSIATARLTGHGPGLGREFRYVADLVPLMILTVGLTVLRPRIGRDEDGPLEPAGETYADEPGIPRPRRWRGVPAGHLGATVLALAALWTVFIVTAVPVSHRWVTARTVHYVPNLEGGIRALDARGPYSLYTAYAPGDINSPAFGRYSQTTRIAQLVSGHPIVADDLSKPMYLVDAQGHVVPARFQTLATVPDACGTSDSLKLMQTLSRPLGKGYWTVQFSYRVARPTTLRFAINTGSVVEEATGGFRGFPVSGTGRISFPLRLASVTQLRFDAGHVGDCISDVQIGRPVPAG